MSDSLNFARVVDQNKVFHTLVATCCVGELITAEVFSGFAYGLIFPDDYAFLERCAGNRNEV